MKFYQAAVFAMGSVSCDWGLWQMNEFCDYNMPFVAEQTKDEILTIEGGYSRDHC